MNITARLRFALLPLLLSGLVVAGGCSASNVTTEPTPPRTASVEARAKAFPIDHEGWAKLGYRYDWTAYPAVAGAGTIHFVDAYPDVLVVQDKSGILSVVEATNGGVRWSSELANPLTKFVGNARDGDHIVCSSESEIFVLAVATGNLLARQQLEKVVNTKPLLMTRGGGSVAIYGTPTGEILAHYVGQGVKLWGVGTAAAIEGRPVLVGPAVGAVSQAGGVFFIDPSSGSLEGRARIFDGVATDPVSNGQLLFIASLDQSLYAFAPTGSQIWRYRGTMPLHVQPTAEAAVVYCDIPDVGLSAFDAGTGKIMWSAKGVHGTVLARRQHHLIAWDGHTLTALDPDRGDVIDKAAMDGLAFAVVDKYEDGNLYAVSKSGVIAKFIPR